MIENNHKIDTLYRCPRHKVRGLKWWTWPNKTFYAAQNVKIIYKNCGFFQNILRDFLFIQISKTDHFEWSKAIIKLKPFWGPPDKKLGVQNNGHGPTIFFTWPKMRKSFLKVMNFCKICCEIYYFFYQKLKTAHFLGQFTIRYTKYWLKVINYDDQHGKTKNNVHLRLFNF